MTCNHAKINDSDRSDAANVDAADAGVEFFQLQRFVECRSLPTLIRVKNVFTI